MSPDHPRALKVDARRLMEQAIAIMQASHMEPRADGKASPRVGAVLLLPDGTIASACRGELRDGDHAEYTLLERKHRSSKLDGAALFATLEPCAPGARQHPKLGCAERIVLARIKQVWIGITDPDPTVDRKGIQYLQDNGVEVHMFDADLQEAIRDANRDFIAQAEERAAAALLPSPEPAALLLSDLERPREGAKPRDFSPSALKAYRRVLGAEGALDGAGFLRKLSLQGLVSSVAGAWVPTGFGLVHLGSEPRLHVPQAALLGTLHYPDGREETRDFEGPAVEVPAQAIQWLKDKLPNPISRSGAERRDLNEPFYELVREGIVNALVHRDYGITGAKCQLVVREASIAVLSPGAPVPPITLEQLQAFEAPMLSRNPVMHFVFAKLALAEERGLGLKSLRTRAAAAGLPLPAFTYRAPYVVLTLYRNATAVAADVDAAVVDNLSASERAGWDWLVTREQATTAEYEAALGVPNRTAKHHLKKLVDVGLLQKTGTARGTRYHVVRP